MLMFLCLINLYLKVGSGAFIPLELCEVPPGQIVRKQVPSEKTKDVVEFATKRPADRLASIRQGIDVSYLICDNQYDLTCPSCSRMVNLNTSANSA